MPYPLCVRVDGMRLPTRLSLSMQGGYDRLAVGAGATPCVTSGFKGQNLCQWPLWTQSFCCSSGAPVALAWRRLSMVSSVVAETLILRTRQACSQYEGANAWRRHVACYSTIHRPPGSEADGGVARFVPVEARIYPQNRGETGAGQGHNRFTRSWRRQFALGARGSHCRRAGRL
jgi:hypothetical protein